MIKLVRTGLFARFLNSLIISVFSITHTQVSTVRSWSKRCPLNMERQPEKSFVSIQIVSVCNETHKSSCSSASVIISWLKSVVAWIFTCDRQRDSPRTDSRPVNTCCGLFRAPCARPSSFGDRSLWSFPGSGVKAAFASNSVEACVACSASLLLLLLLQREGERENNNK